MIVIRLSRQFCKQIKKDLLTNPEFDFIHPEFLEHKPPTTLKREQKEIPYMKSLLKYKDTNKSTYEEALHQNFKTFKEGYISPRGPLKQLSEETKKAINSQISQKLQELEDTGLSREEILTNGSKKGIPLSQDAFFQLIKNNENARYIYLTPGEDFTVNKVVDIALRQDLGQDQFNIPTNYYVNNMKLASYDKQNNVFVNTKDHMEHVNELVQDEVIYHHHPKPQKPQRRVNNYDIHWRNTEFLIQFLNKSAKIRNREQTLLSKTQHKKVARAIKTAKQMMLLPYNSSIQPYHKKSLTSLDDDIEDYARRKINIVTGQIYAETPLQKRERSLEHQTLVTEEYEFGNGINRPADQKIIKGIVYAEKLKKNQLEKQGIKLTQEEEKEKTYRFIGNEVKFQSVREEELLKQEIQKEIDEKQGEFVQEFQEVKSQIQQIPVQYLSQAFITEQTLESERISQLIPKTKPIYNREESLKIIEEVKARLLK